MASTPWAVFPALHSPITGSLARARLPVGSDRSGGGGQPSGESHYLGIFRGMCPGPYRWWAVLESAVVWLDGLGSGTGRELGVGRRRSGRRRAMPWELWAGARCWAPACVDLLRGRVNVSRGRA